MVTAGALDKGGSIEAMNRAVSLHLAAKANGGTPIEHRHAPSWFEGEDSPVWSRRYSESDPSAEDCEALRSLLQDVGAARMVRVHPTNHSPSAPNQPTKPPAL